MAVPLPRREVIGPPECPLLYRWTLIPWGERKHENSEVRWKLMVHRFLPNADDRAVHDHPRPFWTFVLRGGYDDMKPCKPCPDCGGRGVVLNERMSRGTLRFRPAQHAHRTRVHPSGCWTIVLMGPICRRWGFWREGRWYYWKDFERIFGFGMRCEDE